MTSGPVSAKNRRDGGNESLSVLPVHPGNIDLRQQTRSRVKDDIVTESRQLIVVAAAFGLYLHLADPRETLLKATEKAGSMTSSCS